MPDSFELPRMRGAIIPLMGARDAVVGELIADSLPGFAAVVGPLDHLPEPAAALGCVDAIRVHWRAFHVVDLPAGKMRPANIPFVSLAVGGQDEGAFACAD